MAAGRVEDYKRLNRSSGYVLFEGIYKGYEDENSNPSILRDHINLKFVPCPEVTDVLSEYSDYIAEQVLADAITVADASEDENIVIFDIDDLNIGAVIIPA